MNEKALTVIELLQKYAHEVGVIPRSMTDLSPLECWLLNQLINQMLHSKNEHSNPTKLDKD